MLITKTTIKFKNGSKEVSRDPVRVNSVNQYRSDIMRQMLDVESVLFEYQEDEI
jgi:hypothetical protein